MFVEKLTNEQLCNFFDKKYVSFHIDTYSKTPYLYVSYNNESMVINNRMYDFEGSTVSNETEWRNYLYSIFGEEYKNSYAEYLQKSIDEKLSNLKKLPKFEDNLEEKAEEIEELGVDR